MVTAFYTLKYANDIYCQGTNRLTARDGFAGIPTEYQEPVKQYAAANYSKTNIIDVSHSQLWINDDEYNQTLAYRTSSSPA